MSWIAPAMSSTTPDSGVEAKTTTRSGSRPPQLVQDLADDLTRRVGRQGVTRGGGGEGSRHGASGSSVYGTTVSGPSSSRQWASTVAGPSNSISARTSR